MTRTEPEPLPHSSRDLLVDAVERLDEKLGSLEEWIERTESDLDDFQLRWQVCSENITAQLSQVEQELVQDPSVISATPRPQLRIF